MQGYPPAIPEGKYTSSQLTVLRLRHAPELQSWLELPKSSNKFSHGNLPAPAWQALVEGIKSYALTCAQAKPSLKSQTNRIVSQVKMPRNSILNRCLSELLTLKLAFRPFPLTLPHPPEQKQCMAHSLLLDILDLVASQQQHSQWTKSPTEGWP